MIFSSGMQILITEIVLFVSWYAFIILLKIVKLKGKLHIFLVI